MERKKKRDKSIANGVDIENASGQHGDVHIWQREAEQQGNAIPAKKLAVAGGPNSDSPTQPFVPAMNWSYTQQQSLQHTSQQPALPLLPQPQVQAQQQPPPQQGLQGGAQQPLPPGQQSASCWQNPDFSGPSAGAGHYPFHPGSADSNWQASNYGGAQGMGGNAAPYNYPGGFGFPPPPYPGMWDPVSWWAHNVHQQAVYPYSFPGYGSGYAYPVPPAPPVGTYQRGFIKAPPGLSQKHQRLWEAQSMENVQLWATVSRAEAEISCQRSKILKLEADLQAIKAHQDAVMEASAAATVAPQPTRRGRRKKATPAPVAIVGLPAPQPRAQGRKSGNSRANVGKIDLAKNVKEIELEEKEKTTLANHTTVSLDRSSQDQDQKNISLTTGLNRNETGAERNSLRHVIDSQGAVINQNHRLTGEKENLDYSHTNQTSPFRSSLPLGVGKESICEQNLEMKEAPVGASLKSTGNVDNQAGVSSESGLKSETPRISRREDWSGAGAGDGARNVILEARLQAIYGTNGMDRPNAVGSGKVIRGWQYAGEDGSDDQDEVAASGQDDDEADDDEETTLDDMNGAKVGNYMVLDSASASRW